MEPRRRRLGGARVRVPAGRRAQARLTRYGAVGELSARLLIEYDGGRFAGWARQPGRRSVQGVLEDALAQVGRPARLTVAGRTDAGVHARGQVASHPGEPVVAWRLNAVLPGDDVTILESVPASEGFDARRDARSRTYRYRLVARTVPSPFERGRALHWPHPLDRDALDACAGAVVGTHDFTAFTPTQTDHLRFEREVMRAEWSSPEPDVLELWIEADSFMRHMVRTLVGTMLAVASGRTSLAEFEPLLSGRPRAEAGDTAPPHGLYLESVRY